MTSTLPTYPPGVLADGPRVLADGPRVLADGPRVRADGPHVPADSSMAVTWPGRGEATFFAWATRALPRAFPGLPALGLPALRAAWVLAARDIAARLALACAREGLLDSSLVGDLELRSTSRMIVVPVARTGGFDLHRLELDAPRDRALEHPVALLTTIAGDLNLAPATAWRLAAELDDSVFHLAVAHAVAELRVRARLTGLPWPAPLDPENLVISGHPWHPMCKTRIGLHLHEVLRHAPEGLAAPQIHAIDVDADLLQTAGDSFKDMSQELFPAAAPGWLRVPVHVLQRRRLPRLFGALWGERMRPAPVPAIPARALLSLRTVATAGLHVKLAADLHTTSARRQISPMSGHNGPRIGALIDAIAAADPHARRGLRLQHEPASVGLDPRRLAELPGDPSRLAGQLGAIFRHDLRAPTRALAEESERFASRPHGPGSEPGEPVTWVCAALGERWPGDPSELVSGAARSDMSPETAWRPALSHMSLETFESETLMHRREGAPLLRAITSVYPTPTAALRRYVDLLVPPALRLCTAHGVALELHLQNTLVVHRGGRLCGFIVRDLGGVRLHRGRLAAAGHAPELAPGSFTITDDLGEMQTKLAHTLLHAHLGTVFGWAADLLGADETALWAHTRAVIESLLGAWATAQPRLAAACAEDRATLLAPVVQAKALLRMRIDERVSDYAYIRVTSPLADEYAGD